MSEKVPSREILLQSICPTMKLNKSFFLRVYGYEVSTPGFAEKALSTLEEAGCSKAREYYSEFVGDYEQKREEELKRVSAWYKDFRTGYRAKQTRQQEDREKVKI